MSAVRFNRILRRMESRDVTAHQQQGTASLAPQAIHRLFAVSSCLPAASKGDARRSKAVDDRRRSSSVELPLNENPGRRSQNGEANKVLQKWKDVVHSEGRDGSMRPKVTKSTEATAPASHS